MIPYKGTRATNLRQYMKGKPHKWGFKFFVRAGVSGIVYDILPYCVSSTFDQESLTSIESNMGLGAKVVISLSKSIPNPSESVLYFDNFFMSIHLLTHLKENMDILALGTLRKNRIEGCPLLSDKDLKKRGRGSYDHRINGEGIIVVKWVDNKAVCLASTAGGIRPTGTAQRYGKDAKAKVPIPCPRIIQLYNEHVGGVDLSDMLVELYRIPSRARRWYFAIFCYLIDLAIVNAWLQYRRDNSSQTKVLDLKHFRLDVSQGLAARSTTGGEERYLLRNLQSQKNKSRSLQFRGHMMNFALMELITGQCMVTRVDAGTAPMGTQPTSAQNATCCCASLQRKTALYSSTKSE